MFKGYIRRQPASLSVEIYLLNEPDAHFRQGDVYAYFTASETGQVTPNYFTREAGDVPDVKPLLVLHEDEARQLLAAFKDLALQEGLPNDSESHVKGKLEATERHLADMRLLIFKSKPKL